MSLLKLYKYFCLSFSLTLFISCNTPKPVTTVANEEIIPAKPSQDSILASEEKVKGSKPDHPYADREFRAAWVATVANINWPSKPGLSVQEQQKEAIDLLNMLQKNNFNAVIFQVRPQADALYKSDLEPWSVYLTGKQGVAPKPFYDPLQFWIEAAHDRGLELHAWLNPYRAHHTAGKEISEQSVIKTDPGLVVKLKNGMWWMDPAKDGTKKRSTEVVMDLVNRYDLDGIHFDDYFYPYPSYNGDQDFPDNESWNAYLENGGKLSRGDWRRENVNDFISNLYTKIKAEKPRVKFGLSPFGIWRPGYPKSISGYDQYEQLYADAKLWLNKGWIDYFTPQLYWKINPSGQSFPVLLGWWNSQNFENRHLWPGINVDLGGDEKNSDETLNQIMITRGMMPQSPGVVHWSIGPLVKHPELTKSIVEGPYKAPALVPSSPWLDDKAPLSPSVVPTVEVQSVNVNWVPKSESEKAFRYVVYFKYAESWSYKIFNRKTYETKFSRFIEKKDGEKVYLSAIAVTAVDRSGNESEFLEIKLDQTEKL
ncbi:glycoside hydrolase family 10 protein [Salinimicrobium gaetbulicola]|uniref:Glycoside hydrolase family 10 protein n=1 Tax=Salinimicrobium gaetbulicola TaxID=999702 RepID=A0ABW3IGW6_9FLAO